MCVYVCVCVCVSVYKAPRGFEKLLGLSEAPQSILGLHEVQGLCKAPPASLGKKQRSVRIYVEDPWTLALRIHTNAHILTVFFYHHLVVLDISQATVNYDEYDISHAWLKGTP